MNIRLVISNYKNQDGKSNILFDCSESSFRKKIDTGVKVQNINQIGFTIRRNGLDNFSFENKILINKLFDRIESAVKKYENFRWSFAELENYLREPIYIYSVEHYVNDVFSKSKTVITSKDYLNVVKVFKKYLNKSTITFNFLLNPENILKFKFNAQKNNVKQTSINSYLKKMKIIMSQAKKDGVISSTFILPKHVIEKEEKTKNITQFDTNEIIYSVNQCQDIFQVQSLTIFIFLIANHGMNPGNLIDYQILNKTQSNIIKSLILEHEDNYLFFKKSKKGKAIKYVKINFQISRLLSILKSLFHITHFKKYSEMLAPFTEKNKIFDFDINQNYNFYKNFWNFYQKKLGEVSNYNFSNAKPMFYDALKEIEMSRATSQIMFGDLAPELIIKSREFKKIRENIELSENKVYEKLKLNELIAICKNKISRMLDFNITEYSVNTCDTTNEFIRLMRRYDRCILK
jgi:hypothetical protein